MAPGGWKDVQEFDLPEGSTIERDVEDDTLPTGKYLKHQSWTAPFVTANWEEDYAIAWEFFHKQR